MGFAASPVTTQDVSAEIAKQMLEGVSGQSLSADQRLEAKSDTDKVRIVVELEGQPVIEKATDQGIAFKAMGESQVEALTTDLLQAQSAVKESLKSEAIDFDVHYQFTNSLNGFSATTTFGEAKKIEQIEGVKRVYVVNEYQRPEPQMVNSAQITKHKMVWEEFNYTGEGKVVAIIDSGIDPFHKDFNLTNEAAATLTKDKVDAEGLAGTYFNAKVPYGYNYMDNNTEVLDLGAEASMHGMHVAGTVGANGDEAAGGLKGVAPEVQLLGMKVFGNDPDYGSTYGDIIIKAIDDALALGADVMNLSLGATATSVQTDDPEQMAVTRAVNNGVVMSISAGNSALFGEGHAQPLADNPDVGVVGSPGLTAESLQVASVNNARMLFEHQVKTPGTAMTIKGYGQDDWASKSMSGKQTLIAIGGDKYGEPVCYDGIDVKGKVVLVSRGGFAFRDKTEWAYEAGAKGIIVYNNDPGRFFYKDQGGWQIPFMKVQVAEGLELEKLLAGGPITIDITKTDEALSPVAGLMSDFSSWGTTPNLEFKPDIAAPGGHIYSTLQKDTYGFMSGTSMAAPHASGGAALVLQRVDADFAAATHADKVNLVKNIMMNTAKPVQGDGGAYVSPRKQGAGSMDLKAAMETPVLITEKVTGLAKVNLKELNGSKDSFDLIVKNTSDVDVTYNVNMTVQTDKVVAGRFVVEPQLIKDAVTKITIGGSPIGNTVVIPANSTVEMHFEVDVTNGKTAVDNKPLDEVFKNGHFVEGFVTFTQVNSEALSAKESAKTSLDQAKEALEAKKTALEEAKTASAKALQDKEAGQESLDLLKATLTTVNTDIENAGEKIQAAAVAKAKAEEARQAATAALQAANNAKDAVQPAIDAVTEAQALADQLRPIADAAKTAYDKAVAEGLTGDDLTALETAMNETEAAAADAEAKLLERQTAKTAAETAQVQAKEASDKANEAALAAEETAKLAADQVTEEEKAVYEALVAKKAQTEAAIQTATTLLTDLTTVYNGKADEQVVASKEVENAEKDLESKQAAYDKASDTYDNFLPLSVPYVGFRGDWEMAPIFDASRYEADRDSFYNFTVLMDEETSFLGGYTNEDGDAAYGTDYVAFSPNEDGFQDQVQPLFSLLRNASDVKFSILDKDKNVIRTLASSSYMRKHYYDGRHARYVFKDEWLWDGKVNYKTAADGQYFYQVKAKIDGGSDWHELLFPVKLDTVEPTKPVLTYSNGAKTLKVASTDTDGSGIDQYVLFEQVVNAEGKVTPKKLLTSRDGTFDLENLDRRVYRVVVATSDYAANVSEISDEMVINDTAVPEIEMTPESYTVFDKRTVTLKGAISEMTAPSLTMNGEEVALTLNKASKKFEFEKAFTYDTDGEKAVKVKAVDEVNNVIEFERKFYIDATKPVITMKDLPVADDNGFIVVTPETETIALKATISDNYPDLRVVINGSEVVKIEEDFHGYQDKLQPASYDLDQTFALDKGVNKIVVEVFDAAGSRVAEDMKVFRQSTPDEKPPLPPVVVPAAPTDFDLTLTGTDISYNRPIKVQVSAPMALVWTVKILDANGDVAKTEVLPASKTATYNWAPDRMTKLNGTFKVQVSGENAAGNHAEEASFQVYNYETRVTEPTFTKRDGMLNVSAKLTNLEDSNQKPLLVAIVRNENTTMHSISTMQTDIAPDGTVTLSAGLQMPEIGNYTVEFFAWSEWARPVKVSNLESISVEIK